MRKPTSPRRHHRRGAFLTGVLLILLTGAFAAFGIENAHCQVTETWNPNGNGGGNGTWDAGITADWDSGVTWTNSNAAVFSGSGGVLTLVDPYANSLTFSASGPYLLQSGTLTLTGSDVTVSSAATIAGDITSTGGMFLTGAGTLTIANGGGVSTTTTSIASDPGSSGRVTVSGTASTWTNTNYLFVGDSGSGTLLITNGGSVYAPGGGWIGYQSGSEGTVTVSGSGSIWTAVGGISVGGAGKGTLAISNGGAVSSNGSYIGGYYIDGGSNIGIATVTGNGSTWTDAGDFWLAAGTLTIINGGAVSNQNGLISVATDTGTTCTATVSGNGSTWTNIGNLCVGGSGTGTLLITNGGGVSDDNGYIGENAGSNGMVKVSGSGSTWTNTGNLYISDLGIGALAIRTGGAVSSSNSYIGNNAGSLGRVLISGSGSIFSTSATLVAGESGTGGLAIAYGATVTSGSGGSLGDQAGSVGIVTLSGPGSTWSDGGELIVGGSGTGVLAISDGGSVSNVNGWIGDGAGSAGLVIVSGSGSAWSNGYIGNLYVGNSGTGTLIISNGGAASAGAGYIGNNAGSTGAVRVSGTGSNLSLGDLYAGNSGTGSVVINGGGELSSFSSAYIGYNPGSNGTVTVSGSGSILTVTGAGYNLNVGLGGTGTLAITGGGFVSDGNGLIGNGPNSSGTVIVSGSGSTWANQLVIVGGDGTGRLVITGGGTVTSSQINVDIDGPGTMTISDGGTASDVDGSVGEGLASVGSVTVTGAGSKWTNSGPLFLVLTGTLAIGNGGEVSYGGEGVIGPAMVTVSGSGSQFNGPTLQIGTLGIGTMVISSGGSATDVSGNIGDGPYSLGRVLISGSGSVFSNSATLVVGESGTGGLAVAYGATVTSGSGGILGDQAGSTGIVTVTGSGSQWIDGGSLILGNAGVGVLVVREGGLVSVAGTTTIGSAGTLELDGASTFNTRSLTINDGTVITLGNVTFAPSGALGPGGINVNTFGFNSIFSGNFGGSGGVTKTGTGRLALTGASNYTGPTTIKAGTLALTTASTQTASLGDTAIYVESGAAFTASLGASPFSRTINAGTIGSGSAGATLTLAAGSTFSMAGNSLATFNLRQENSFSGPAFTIGGASGIAPRLIFDIGNAAAGTDLLNVTKTVSVLATGGDITIDALAGDTSLTAGNYELIVSGGGFSGARGNGLALSGTTPSIGGATYDLSLAESTADDEVLTVSDAAPAPRAPESSLTGFDASGEGGIGGTPAGRVVAPLVGNDSVPEPGVGVSLLYACGIAAAWQLRRRRGARRNDA